MLSLKPCRLFKALDFLQRTINILAFSFFLNLVNRLSFTSALILHLKQIIKINKYHPTAGSAASAVVDYWYVYATNGQRKF